MKELLEEARALIGPSTKPSSCSQRPPLRMLFKKKKGIDNFKQPL
jgi:hypothetical protein